MRSRVLCFVLAMLMVVSTASAKSSGTFGISEMFCQQQSNPVGVGTSKPRFSWQVLSSRRGFEQRAYQILVSDSKELIDQTKGDMWDSGRCNLSESNLIEYQGRELKSSTKYYWRVRVWSNNRSESQWSEPSEFVTGVLNPQDWGGAEWLSLEADSKQKSLVPGIHAPLVYREIGERMVGDYKLPIFRRELSLDKPIEQAFVSVVGLGHFEMFIDGEKVGNHFLDPGWTNYGKKALYVTFDVSDELQRNSVVGIMLGNGFYNVPRERYFKQLVSYGAPKVKLSLDIKYSDGTSEQIVTDGDWRVSQSPIYYSSIYGGEDYDARQDQEGWMCSGFDDSSWVEPTTTEYDIELRSQESAPLYVRDELSVVRKYKNSRGNWIYDFGQNFSGVVRLNVKGERGDVVKIVPGELLDADSLVNQRASGGPYSWSYTLKGGEAEQWQPQFTYYGFRYLEVEGVERFESLSFVGLHTTNSAAEVGEFACSETMFNKTYDLIDWSVRSNLASILTDCPHREKLGWLEVAHLMQFSMQYRYQLSGLYHKIMGDIHDSQTDEGIVPSIAPEYVRFGGGFENSPEWGSAAIIIPWQIYKFYGDLTLVEEYYDVMKRYMEYLSTRADDGIVAYGLGDWFDLGPRNPGVSQLTSKGVTSTGMYYYNATIMSKMAALCGKEDDSRYYSELAADIKRAYNKAFYDPKTHKYDRNSQTASAISLYFGLVEEQNRDKVYANLLDDIKSRNYALTAGDIGYRYLLRVLEDNGDSDIIYRMNTKYDAPGYGWQIAYGATALTESWQAYGFVSNNHCMLGHLMEWLFSGLGGISQCDTSVGFKRVKVAPQMVDGVNNATTSYTSPYGEIECSWAKTDDGYKVKVNIPANSSAEVHLPASSISNIYESGRKLSDLTDCVVREGAESVIVEVGSGYYEFKVME